MAVTNPDVSAYQGMSMFLVPTDTPGVNIVRNVGLGGEPLGEGRHALIHYEDVRVPADALLGGEGQAFAIAQTRLGGGRIHHAMRTIGLASKALDMMCERALSRETQGSLLADKQFVQGYIADSYAQLKQFRLFVLYTAWSIDKHNDYRKVRKDIAAVKVLMPGVLHDIAQRAMQVHGALGVSNEMPFRRMLLAASVLGLADGPTEVHKVTVARQVLRGYRPATTCGPPSTCPGSSPPRGRSSPSTSSTRWGTCDTTDPSIRPRPGAVGARRVDGRARACPARASRIECRYISGGSQNEIYEIRRGDLHCAMRIPPPTAPADRDEGILPRVAHHRGARRHRRPAHRGRRRVRRPVGAGPDLLPDGLRRRLVADGPARRLAGAVRHRPRRPGRGWPTSWSRASRCCPRSTGGRRACRTWAGPTASTSARSTGGPPSSTGSRAANCPASTRRPPGCGPTGRSTTSPASCTATTSSPT